MTTIVTVHGTFAHIDVISPAGDGNAPAATAAWWQKESAFAKLVAETSGSGADGDAGRVRVEPFVWTGSNSESDRREAAARLLELLKSLEDLGETYSIVAHSHGGSVVSAALLLSVGKKVKLDGLRKWITVGTPFVDLRKERLLFTRLPILMKAVFVASLMLFSMFLIYMIADLAESGWTFGNSRKTLRFAISAGLTGLPFLLVWIVAKIWDGRQLFFYRRRVVRRARERFAGKWVGLCHEDDEVVQGLTSLKKVNVPIFHSNFAVPAISVLSAFLLPVVYLYVLLSPPTMVALADYLRTKVYDVAGYRTVETSFRTAEAELRTLRRDIRRTRRKIDEAERNSKLSDALQLKSQLSKLRERRVKLMEDLRAAYPNFIQLQRAGRFARRFLSKPDPASGLDIPCPGETLCEGGGSLALNSQLLFHLVTDEASSLFVDDDVRRSHYGRAIRVAVPIILVPIVFGLAAVVLVLLVQTVAGWFSRIASKQLDAMTWAQFRRSALGNDTESEVARGASTHPSWIETAPRYLAPALRDILTARSNEAMSESLGKIRNAISDLAFGDVRDNERSVSVLGFLNWKELIHTTYFEVPEFRAFVAHILSTDDGFGRKDALATHLDGAVAAQWFAALDPASTRA